MILYHGSSVTHLKKIQPMAYTSHDDKRVPKVYLSDDIKYAACFCIQWNDKFGRLSIEDDDIKFVVNIDKFKGDFNKPVSIYRIDSTTLDDSKLEEIEEESKEYIYFGEITKFKEYYFKSFYKMLEFVNKDSPAILLEFIRNKEWNRRYKRD